MVAAIPFAYWQAASGGGGGGSAPTIVEAVAATDSSGGSGDSITIGFTANVTAGQYVLLFAISGDQASNSMLTPSGFTQLYGDNTYWGVYAKKMVGNEGNLFSISEIQTAGILVGIKISGVNSTPLDVSASAGAVATGSSVTTTAANTLLFSVWMTGVNVTPTLPSGWTLVTLAGAGVNPQFVNSAHGGPVRMMLAYQTQAAAGACGTQNWVSACSKSIVTIAVKP